MKTSVVILATGLGLFAVASRTEAITIVRQGQAQAVIVVPAAGKVAGAADLQTYVEKVSGAKLEILSEDKLGDAKSDTRIFLGPCRATSRIVDIKRLQPEGFVIKTDGNDLFIVGPRRNRHGHAGYRAPSTAFANSSSGISACGG